MARTAKIPKKPRQYRIELEVVFAFHEDELLKQAIIGVHPNGNAKKRPPIPLKEAVKNVSYKTRASYKSSTLENRVYNSWLVRGPLCKVGGVRVPRSMSEMYTVEPPKIARTKLSGQSLLGVISAQHSMQKAAEANFDKWFVVPEYNVCGVGSINLHKWLPDRVPEVNTEWDSFGIKLLSPYFPRKRGMNRIGQALTAIQGGNDSKHGAFITNQCGLHVHVECPNNLEVLKKLAILLINLEEDISKLHPSCRGPTHENAKNNFESNRLGVLNCPENLPTYYGQAVSDEYLENIATNGLPYVDVIEASVNACRTTEELSRLFQWPATSQTPHGNRNRQVNLLPITSGPGESRTIEFRQSRGSLNAEYISHWVRLCTGLVDLAERWAADPEDFSISSWTEFDAEFEADIVITGFTKGGVRVPKCCKTWDILKAMDNEDGTHEFEYWTQIRGNLGIWDAASKKKIGRIDDTRLDNEVPPGEEAPSTTQSGPRKRKASSGSGHDSPSKVPKNTRSSVPGAPSRDQAGELQAQDPAKYKHAPEDMMFDGFGWKVRDFNIDEWEVLETSIFVGPRDTARKFVCSLNALTRSMTEQYPNSKYARTSASELLPILDKVLRDLDIKATLQEDTHVEEVLNRWTNGEFKLVMYGRHYPTPSARRVILRNEDGLNFCSYGHNLYLAFQTSESVVGEVTELGTDQGHWEAMRKRSGKPLVYLPATSTAARQSQGPRGKAASTPLPNTESLSPRLSATSIFTATPHGPTKPTLSRQEQGTVDSIADSLTNVETPAPQILPLWKLGDALPPKDGQEAAPGAITPVFSRQPMQYDGLSWKLKEFKTHEWEIMDTPATIGARKELCSLHAMTRSMTEQYPDSVYANTDPANLLKYVTQIGARENCALSEDDVDEIIDLWTSGAFVLMYHSTYTQHITASGRRGQILSTSRLDGGQARRVGALDAQHQHRVGRNLLLSFEAELYVDKDGNTTRRTYGHWASMKRKG